MPHLIDHADRVDLLTSAAIHVISSEGITAFTLRRIAAVARVSPSSVSSHLDNKSRMTDLITKRISDRLIRETRSAVRADGTLGLVPANDLVPLVRGWLGVCELARGDDALAGSVAYLEDEHHRDLVAWACRLDPQDRVGLDSMHALVVGLWTARSARSDALTEVQAQRALRHACEAWSVPIGPPDL